MKTTSTALKKRYWLFAYSDFYPAGGMNDFRGSFHSIGESLLAFTEAREDSFHVYDSESGRILRKEELTPSK